jgi:hypothetical protein
MIPGQSIPAPIQAYYHESIRVIKYYSAVYYSIYSLGIALGAFWLSRDTGRESASCAGGQENSSALQASDCAHSAEHLTYGGGAAESTCPHFMTQLSGKSVVTGGELNLCAKQPSEGRVGHGHVLMHIHTKVTKHTQTHSHTAGRSG